MSFSKATWVLAAVALVAAVSSTLLPFDTARATERGSVEEQEYLQLLNADYAFTQMNTCVATAAGTFPPTFNPTTLQLIGEAETLSFVTKGISSFDGAGNWSGTGEGTIVYHDRTSPGDSPIAPPAPFECEGSYSVAQDRTFSIDGSCQITEPPFVEGSSFLIEGRISVDRQTLILHQTAPVIQELSVPGVGVVVERICTAIATDVRALKQP
jgi:hypothetical protein